MRTLREIASKLVNVSHKLFVADSPIIHKLYIYNPQCFIQTNKLFLTGNNSDIKMYQPAYRLWGTFLLFLLKLTTINCTEQLHNNPIT